MKPMNDQRFFDLAMKAIARQASGAERVELDALLAANPAMQAEFERLRTEAALAKEVLPLVQASAAANGKLPAYARGRLQTKVRESLGRPRDEAQQPDRSLAWGWRWWLGLAATATAVLVGLAVFVAPSRPVVVQLAVLDLAGASRGAGDTDETLLRTTWRSAEVNRFESGELLAGWLKAWPTNQSGTVVKVIYDRAAGELRVSGQRAGRRFAKDFPLRGSLEEALLEASAYVREETKH
jgi:hypothetical protein